MFEFNPQILDHVYLLASLGCQHNSTNWPRLRIKEKTSLLQKLLCTGSSNWSFQLSVILWARNPFEISSSLHWTLPMQIHTQLDPILVFGILTSFWGFLLIEHCSCNWTASWISCKERESSCSKNWPTFDERQRHSFEVSSSLNWTLPAANPRPPGSDAQSFPCFWHPYLTSFWLFILIEHCNSIWTDRKRACS